MALFGLSHSSPFVLTVEALGNYLSHNKKPLEVLNHPLFGKSYSAKKIENLVCWYRHLLAHAAIIAPGILLTPEPEGEPFDFEGEEPIRLPVIPFHRMVRDAWRAFDKKLLINAIADAPCDL